MPREITLSQYFVVLFLFVVMVCLLTELSNVITRNINSHFEGHLRLLGLCQATVHPNYCFAIKNTPLPLGLRLMFTIL